MFAKEIFHQNYKPKSGRSWQCQINSVPSVEGHIIVLEFVKEQQVAFPKSMKIKIEWLMLVN